MRIVRRDAKLLGYTPSFSICDAGEQTALVRKAAATVRAGAALAPGRSAARLPGGPATPIPGRKARVWALGVLCLVIFGWLSAISSLLQYTLIQTQTPEGMLGRINGLWTAQNVTGDAIGAAILGGLGAMMTPVASASSSGFALAVVGGILLLVLAELRRFRQEVVLNDSAA